MYSYIDTVILDRLPKNCSRLYYYWISFSSNMKVGGGGGRVSNWSTQNKLPSEDPA